MDEDKFKPDMLIAEALEADEGAADVLEKFGLPCYRCAVADVETIAEGAAGKGLDAGRILAALNSLTKNETRPDGTAPGDEEEPERSSTDEG